MTAAREEAPRYDGIDAIRAGSMMLGLAYHASYAYVPEVGRWYFVQDVDTSEAFRVLSGALHCFRMQVFFVASGFLARLLLERKGSRVFVRDRARRLVVPFLFAAPTLWLLDMALRHWETSRGLLHPLYEPRELLTARPLHLWFLEALLVFSFAAWAVRALAEATGLRGLTHRVMARLLRVPELFVLGAVVTGFFLTLLHEPKPGLSYLLDASTLLHYGLFFAFGWALHSGVSNLTQLRRCGWMVLPGAALSLWVFSRDVQWRDSGLWLAALAAWLMVLGVFGLAVRLPHADRPWLRALVDASYWVYLVHYPLIAFGHVALAQLPWPAVVKYLLVVAATTAVSLLSFRWWVRGSRLGPWLGSKRTTRPV